MKTALAVFAVSFQVQSEYTQMLDDLIVFDTTVSRSARNGKSEKDFGPGKRSHGGWREDVLPENHKGRQRFVSKYNQTL